MTRKAFTFQDGFKEYTLYYDVYTLEEMIQLMKKNLYNIFLIDDGSNFFQYDINIMKKLKKRFKSCYIQDRYIVMLEEGL